MFLHGWRFFPRTRLGVAFVLSREDAYFLPSFLCDAEDESVMAALQLELETEGKVMSDWHGARHLGASVGVLDVGRQGLAEVGPNPRD